MTDRKMLNLFCWLTFDQHGVNKMFKKQPGLHRGEKAIQVRLVVPVDIFKEPELVATIQMVGNAADYNRQEIVAKIDEALDAIPDVFVRVEPLPEATHPTQDRSDE